MVSLSDRSMKFFRHSGCLCVFIIALLMMAVGPLFSKPRLMADDGISVLMPVPIQLLLSGGDRFLAANAGYWRVLMMGANRQTKDVLLVLSETQLSISFLNPGHEDNYYTAAAVLPWEGFVAPTQTILQRAMDARPFDPYPVFYAAFNQAYFNSDGLGAAKIIREHAPSVTDEGLRQALFILGSKWASQGDNLQLSISVVQAMAQNAKELALRDYLNQRVLRLQNLKILRDASAEYERRLGHGPASLEALVEQRVIDKIPEDPLKGGYTLKDRKIELRPPKN